MRAITNIRVPMLRLAGVVTIQWSQRWMENVTSRELPAAAMSMLAVNVRRRMIIFGCRTGQYNHRGHRQTLLTMLLTVGPSDLEVASRRVSRRLGVLEWLVRLFAVHLKRIGTIQSCSAITPSSMPKDPGS